jgi:hypothetical protein
MRGAVRIVAALAGGCLLAAVVAADAPPAGDEDLGGPARLSLGVVSSRPDQVTGGDARVVVAVPHGVPVNQVRLAVFPRPRFPDSVPPTVFPRPRFPDQPTPPTSSAGAHLPPGNGTDVTASLRPTPQRPRRRLTAVVAGLRTGANVLTATAGGQRATLTLDDHGAGPVFSGPRQYPFVCKTDRNQLGQPIIDNRRRTGLRIYAERNGTRVPDVVGWSRDCTAHTKIDYVYRSSDGTFHPLPDPRRRPDDIVETTTLDGRSVPYVVRRERGTVNRFVYSIAMLVPPGSGDPRDVRGWNGRLLYRFGGGVGRGHDQGVLSDADSLYHDGLSRGYAVAASTGTQTGVQTNMTLSAETALMVKEHFIEAYGIPRYTVGVGGSGGGVQQYLAAEHHPGLIDAAIPQFAFPDFITRFTGIGDCEPLEHYMDTSGDPTWRTWAKRVLVEGLAAGTTAKNPNGVGVCAHGWRGTTQQVFNPRYATQQPEWAFMDPPGVMDKVRWSHWEDLRGIYGRDDAGFARRTWDNVGVQYGLRAMRQGRITPEQFLDLNGSVGGWKQPRDMRPEGCPYAPPGCGDVPDPWSARNLTGVAHPATSAASTGENPGPAKTAPRTHGSAAAIRAAYDSGQVFTGRVSIPIIDWRPYLDDQFDVHDAVESFISRQRIADARGDAGNQVIWFTAANPFPVVDETGRALEVMDAWLARIKSHPDRSVAASRPRDAVDHCTDAQGEMIAVGPHVWDGILDRRAPGPCTQRFPVHSTARIAAGGPYSDITFKCRLQPVDRAIAHGLYGSWRPTAAESRRLHEIFPAGVCDYS